MYLKPTEAEWEILQILWEKGSSTVKFVNEIQNSKRKVGYTTTLKIMQIMSFKKFLVVNKDNRQHIYKPAIDQEKTENTLLNSFLEKTFNGSSSKLIMQLLICNCILIANKTIHS